MKRKNQRLSLSRETLKMLEAPTLEGIGGGRPTIADPTCRLASCGRPCSNNDICSSVCP